ncbi:MAG: DNA-binding response regulator [Saprospirales bacterium]|nr:DNA-binding response regulator [Saprospirales bacterium]
MNSRPPIEVLIADPAPQPLEELSEILGRESFIVRKATDGLQVLQNVEAQKPDALIMEVSLPQLDGVEVCRKLRSRFDHIALPIVFVTSRNESFTEIAAFEAGADDFILKPIRPRVFLTRLGSLIQKRQNLLHTSSAHPEKKLIVDSEKLMIYKGRDVIELPYKEFRLVQLLTAEPGKVFTRREIMDRIWGEDAGVDQRVIDVYVRNLRKKIGAEFFKTIKGVGYRYQG